MNKDKTSRVVAINPLASEIGTTNAILSGKAKQHHVANFLGPLSIKTVLRGSAVWKIENMARRVDDSNYLVLNQDRRYTITVDSPSTVETFCLFFRPGFVEDVRRAEGSSAEPLLDDPFGSLSAPVEFLRRYTVTIRS